MSHCLLLAAVEMRVATNMCHLDILNVNQFLEEVGKCLPNNQLPVRTVEEIREELLRIRHRWNRVVELKKFEAGLLNTSISQKLAKIRFQPLEYDFHVKVILQFSILTYFEIKCYSTNMLFNKIRLNVQHWPSDAEFINKVIPDYDLMKTLFGGLPKGRPESTLHADAIKAAIKRATAEANADEDFTPRSLHRARRKAEIGGSSKAVADDTSDEDFTQRSHQQFKRNSKR